MMKTRLRLALGAVLGAALVAPAAAQQRVSIYTAHTANIVERLIPEFEKATGIKADVVKAGSGDIINRVRAESANPKADVIWSIGAELLEANTDLLERVPAQGSGDDRRRVQDQRRVASVHRHPQRLRRQHEEAEARGISEDLGRSRAAAVQEPGVDGRRREVGLGLHAAQHLPDDLRRQAGRLGQVQGACSTTSNVSASSGAVPRFVNDGEAVVGITLEDNAYLYLKGGGPVAIVYPEDGTSVIADGMALVQARAESGGRQGVHRLGAAARRCRRWSVQELGRRPIRKDAQPLAALKPLDQIKLVKYDIKNAADKRKEYIDKWQALVQAR